MVLSGPRVARTGRRTPDESDCAHRDDTVALMHVGCVGQPARGGWLRQTAMRIRPAPPVSEQPEVRLSHWRIYQVEGAHRLVGYCLDSGCYRVTTPLRALDLDAGTAVTASGRRYQLLGPTALPEDWPTAMSNETIAVIAGADPRGVRDVTAEVTSRRGH